MRYFKLISKDFSRKNPIMAYTPELSYRSSCTLRRIAWALEIPMTKAMERVFDHIAGILDQEKVCVNCRDDSRCDECAFNQNVK